MNKLVFFYPDGHEKHFEPGHPERPDRVEIIVESLIAKGYWGEGKIIHPVSLTIDQLSRTHDIRYLDMIRRASSSGRRLDGDTYTTMESWDLALQAAGGAVAVAREVWYGRAETGFAITRPPGHHATYDRGMGFCLINNIAVAANDLITECGAERVAIVDIDLHHGNGTQDIFYQRGDVLFISLHQSPLYPGTGAYIETGEGDGRWRTMNIPISPYSGDEAYGYAFENLVIPVLHKFSPEMILVSYGFDAHWKDPLGSLALTEEGYRDAINRLLAFANDFCNGKLTIILEGGYDLSAAKHCSEVIVSELLGKDDNDEAFPEYSGYSSRKWKNEMDQIVNYWKPHLE